MSVMEALSSIATAINQGNPPPVEGSEFDDFYLQLVGKKPDWDDWKTHVPLVVLQNWSSLTQESRLVAFLSAQSATFWRER